MPIVLPPSLDKRIHTLREETEFARSLTPQQRLEVVAKVCASAIRILEMHPKRDKVLATRAPLPESTRLALKRLRRGA